jgi:hypothetical protein
MRVLPAFIILAVVGGSWWLWNNNQHIKGYIEQYIENGEFTTLEARYTPEQIMDSHKKELIPTDQHSFQESSLKFFPYSLMEVKYTQPDKKTKESVILWSLVDGEMILNTDTWEKTHGFEDAILANASRNDFKIINALAKNNTMNYDQLQKELHLEKDTFQPWIQSALDKKLIIQKGNEFQLHFQNPKMLVSPQTKITQWLVTKPYNHAQRIAKHYSQSQIEGIASSAFGDDFAIRNSKEVFLPVYTIEVLNPDGSVLTSYWNALNGQRINPKYWSQNSY